MNNRKVSYEILKKVIEEKAYANLVMRGMKIDPFVSEMVYGVLRNYDLLTYKWQDLAHNKVRTKNVILINMAIYELDFLNSEAYATINEIVNLAHPKDKGFVNAILRKYLKEGSKKISEPYIQYSIPKWIYNMWKAHYGDEIAIKIMESCNHSKPMYYWLNTLKKGDLPKDIEFINDHVFKAKNNLLNTKEFKEGLFLVQDYGSSQIIENLALKDNLKVLDMCSAPGTKSYQMAIKMHNTGSILSLDLYEHRVELIKNRLNILGINNIEAKAQDGTIEQKDCIEQFDRVLLDAPCSGLGVLASKPDIKFKLKGQDIDEICAIQAKLFDNAIKYLKRDGIMVYSTCSLNKKENEKQVRRILNENENLELIKEKTIFPFENDTDGFYYACIIKH